MDKSLDKKIKIIPIVFCFAAYAGFITKILRYPSEIEESAALGWGIDIGLAILIIAFTLYGWIKESIRRKRIESAIRYREKLLTEIAKVTKILLSTKNIGEAMRRVLEHLGNAASVDRVYVLQDHELPGEDIRVISQRYELCRHGITPTIDNAELQNVPYSELGQRKWYDIFLRGDYLTWIKSELPESERDMLPCQDVLSMLIFPIFAGNRFWGFIGFDYCTVEYKWTQIDKDTLSIASSCIGSAVNSLEAEAAQKKIEYLTNYDHLTELPNRVLFTDMCKRTLQSSLKTRKCLE